MSLDAKRALMKEIPPPIFLVHVKPHAKKNSIEGWQESLFGKVLKVSVTSPPRDGKANQALLSLLSLHFDRLVSCFKLKKGATSSMKWIQVSAS